MTTDLLIIKQEMDEWIKEMQNRISKLEVNIDYNFTKIKEINERIEKIQEQLVVINLLMLTQSKEKEKR